MVCDWCDTMFDHVIVPPPGLWPIILWWGFLALLALSGIFGLLWLLGWL